MPQNYFAAIQTAKYLVASASGTALSAAGLLVQLNQPHVFLYLNLPFWFFLASTIALVFLGAFLSLKNDYMQTQGTPLGNFGLALSVGLVLSFVVLPVVQPEPSVGLMQLSGFFGGLFGTILMRVAVDLVGDEELRQSVVRVGKAFLIKWLGNFGGKP